MAAIVVTCNGADWIHDCLQSLAQSLQPASVIVVDNGSTDQTLDIVGSFPDVMCLPQSGNLGFGRANNLGFRVALESSTENIFLLNQDARIQPHTIGRLVRCVERNPEYGVLSPMQLNHDGSHVDEPFAQYVLRGAPRFHSDSVLGQLDEVYSVPYVNAAAWLISRKCLERVGGFDPLFAMYGEDNDYAVRVRSREFKVGIVPSASVHHSRSNDLNGPKPQPELMLRSVAEVILGLKDPNRSLAVGYAAVLWKTALLTLHSLICGEPRKAAARALAWLRVNAMIPKIRRHREMSRTGNMPWLAVEEIDS